jgi:hypothetical protein
MEYHDKHISKIRLDPRCVLTLRSELAEMGIKHGTVYGDLQSVAAALQGEFGIA